jgi:hypothetical protein
MIAVQLRCGLADALALLVARARLSRVEIER